MKSFKILFLTGFIASFAFLAPKLQAQCIQSDAFNDSLFSTSVWTPIDINDATVGSQSEGSALTILADGAGFNTGSTMDSFRYIYQQVTGDIDVTLQIDAAPTQALSKLGLMIRNSLNDADVFAFVGVANTNAFSFRYRNVSGATNTNLATAGTYTNPSVAFIRLTHLGTNVWGYYSADGVSWTEISTFDLTGLTASPYYVGIATTSSTAGTLGTGIVNNFNVLLGVCSPTPTPTPTPTATNTKTNTATLTATITDTNTITNTATFTPTATATNTATLTATNTATYTATPTVTSTPVNPPVAVAQLWTPVNPVVIPGTSGVTVMEFQVTNNSATEGVSFLSLVLTGTTTGTANDATGIAQVKLFDTAGQATGDTYTGSAPLTLGLAPRETLGIGASQTYVVTYDFTTAPLSGSYAVTVGTGGLMGVGINSGKPIAVSVSPLPLGGDVVTESLPTATVTPTATNTATLTTTFTSTDTVTNTATNTATYTDTPTVTNSATLTTTFTATNTPTNTATNSATPTATNTATSTPTMPVISIATVAQTPPDSTHIPGAFNVPVMQLTVTNTSGEGVNLNTFVLNGTTTGGDLSGITAVKLLKNGTLLTSGVYSGSGSVTLGGFPLDQLSAAPSAAVTYLVTYNFSTTAVPATYSANLASGGFQGVGVVTGQPVSVVVSSAPGTFPVTGATITIATPTPTATATSTNSATNTVTATPTDTVTNTATLTTTSTATDTVTEFRDIYGNLYGHSDGNQ